MAPGMDVASRRVRVAALFLIVGLAAGPLATHVYWMLGGTWGLYTFGVRDEVATTGIRVVAAVVVVLLVAAVLVVLARVGLWQQAIVSDRAIRFFAWALAAVFLGGTVSAVGEMFGYLVGDRPDVEPQMMEFELHKVQYAARGAPAAG